LSILLEAGVLRFTCPEFSVEFPHPAPAVVYPTEVSMPAATAQGSFPQPDTRSPYDRLFGGNKPTLGSAE
jgi:hypothetical protein